MINNNNIGGRIREIRKILGLSQMKLAEKLDVSYQQVQKYEKGKSKLSITKLSQIADVLGIPARDLVAPDGTQYAFDEMEAEALRLFSRLSGKEMRSRVIKMLWDLQRLQKLP